MDFELDEDQRRSPTSPPQILPEKLPASGCARSRPTADRFADDVWKQLATPACSACRCPRTCGGGGFGFLEACLVLEQIGAHGRAAALSPRPWSARRCRSRVRLAGAARRRSCRASSTARSSSLPRSAEAGDELRDVAAGDDRARRDGGGWRLDGEKRAGPAAHVADRILVPARTGDERVRRVPRRPARRRRHARDAPRRRRASRWSTVRLDGVRVAASRARRRRDGGTDDRGLDHRAARRRSVRDAGGRLRRGAAPHRRARVRARAVRPEDRDVPGRRAARRRRVHRHRGDPLTARQAAWRLAEGRRRRRGARTSPSSGPPRAASASRTPRSTCTAASASTSTTRCIRYFRWTRQIELTLGGAAVHLKELGDRIAAGHPSPPTPHQRRTR